MACIGNCPTEAIGYNNITNGKTPYNFGKYDYILKTDSVKAENTDK